MARERRRGEYRVSRGEYTISTDKAWLDIGIVHRYLTSSHWAAGRSPDTVKRSVENSLTFGLYKGRDQLGLARVVTDYATFAYLAEIFVLEPYRGRGLGKWLMEVMLSHPDLQGLQRWLLATVDAHELYRRYGFTELKHPEIFMEIHSAHKQR